MLKWIFKSSYKPFAWKLTKVNKKTSAPKSSNITGIQNKCYQKENQCACISIRQNWPHRVTDQKAKGTLFILKISNSWASIMFWTHFGRAFPSPPQGVSCFSLFTRPPVLLLIAKYNSPKFQSSRQTHRLAGWLSRSLSA